MYHSPHQNLAENNSSFIRGSSESKKRKSVTELDDGLHDHLTQSLPTPGSPTTSEDSANQQAVAARISPNGASTSLPAKIINPALLKALSESQNASHPDSDATTEEENHTNTRQDATETIDNHQPLKPTFSSIFTSPTFMERIEKEITEATPVSATSTNTKSPTSSHKKARFNDDFSPKLTRQRSYTFSTAAEYTQSNSKNQTSGLDALSWLASIAESEVNAAKSLFSLSHSHDLIAEEGDEEEEDEEEEEQDDGEEGDDEEARTPKEGSASKGAVRYLDPYLVNESNSDGKILSKPRSRANSHVEENNNNNNSSSSEAFGGVSYFQSFQKQQAEGWGNHNNKSSFNEPMMINSADRLQLLTSSAGLIASPMSKRVLLDEDHNNLTIKLPFRRPSISSSGTANTVTTSSTNSNQLNYHHHTHGSSSSAVMEKMMSESHYLDMEDMQGMNPNGGGKLLYPGRARAASMSLRERSKGGLSAGFDHTHKARI
jgi:hypothetical protein